MGFLITQAIGQTPGRESDKRRLAFRTESGSEGWRAEVQSHDVRD